MSENGGIGWNQYALRPRKGAEPLQRASPRRLTLIGGFRLRPLPPGANRKVGQRPRPPDGEPTALLAPVGIFAVTWRLWLGSIVATFLSVLYLFFFVVFLFSNCWFFFGLREKRNNQNINQNWQRCGWPIWTDCVDLNYSFVCYVVERRRR